MLRALGLPTQIDGGRERGESETLSALSLKTLTTEESGMPPMRRLPLFACPGVALDHVGTPSLPAPQQPLLKLWSAPEMAVVR